MKKIIYSLLLLVTTISFGQVGIGTTTPNAAAALDISSTNRGLGLPNLTTAQRNTIASPAKGLTIFNTTTDCMEYYNGTSWITPCLGSIISINCAGATNNGTLTSGTVASGVSSVISYTGGNGSAHSGQVVTSTGVTGLTATLDAGSFASGAGTLTYTITGTPSANGTASFDINIGGQTCTLSRTVAAAVVIPPTIIIAQNQMYMIASVYDQDYLPYTIPTVVATTAVQAANGINEAVTVNYQGTITTTGVTVYIPVTATGSNTLPAYSTTITIPANLTEDGISRDLTLSWASQAYTAATKTITATIKAVGGTLNAKKLDINAGIGNDVLGILLGAFTFPYNNAGATTSYNVRDIAGIPDKMFGLADNNGNTATHMMLYLPVQAEDGNIWLNNNLGADYSNINSTSFNLAQQATSTTDTKGYGNLIQWGRKPDGHDLINRTTGVPVNVITNTTSDNPTNALFISVTPYPYDWRTTQNITLWTNEASANNPCPVGFRVPTNTEYSIVFGTGTPNGIATSVALKLTLAGLRSYHDGNIYSVGSYGYYWASVGNTSNQRAYSLVGQSTYANMSGNESRGGGHSVRCIKN